MNVNHFIGEKTLIFEITEELDHHSTEKIRKRADFEIQRLMPKQVIMDFKRVSFMDSAGIGFILGRYNQIKSFDGELKLRNVSQKLRRIFEMSGILKIIPILDDENIEKIS